LYLSLHLSLLSLSAAVSGQGMKLTTYLNLVSGLKIGAILKNTTGTHMWIASIFSSSYSFSPSRASSGVPFKSIRRSSSLLHIFISGIVSRWE
jgi:hypothetical protein